MYKIHIFFVSLQYKKICFIQPYKNDRFLKDK